MKGGYDDNAGRATDIQIPDRACDCDLILKAGGPLFLCYRRIYYPDMLYYSRIQRITT